MADDLDDVNDFDLETERAEQALTLFHESPPPVLFDEASSGSDTFLPSFDSDDSDDDEKPATPPPPPFRFMCAGAKRDPVACDFKSTERWLGRCPKCHRYYDCLPIKKSAAKAKKHSMAALAVSKPLKYLSTGIRELDMVLGQTPEGEPGGLVPGGFYLLVGVRGTGKTTLLLRMADSFATEKHPVLVASGEMNEEQVGYFIQRLKIKNPNVYIHAIEDIPEIESTAKDIGAKVVIVDSMQTCSFSDIKADTGTPAQIDAAAQFFDSFANDTNKIIFAVGHLTKSGEPAGTEKLQHLVDGIFYLEPYPTIDVFGEVVEETKNVIRLFVLDKNRFGSKNAEAFFEMDDGGRLISLRTSTIKARMAAEKERKEAQREAEKVIDISDSKRGGGGKPPWRR